jgi:hypothetical protein
VHHHFKVKNNTDSLIASELYLTGKKLSNIFRNEHIFDEELTMNSFNERMMFIKEASILNYDKEKDIVDLVNQ